MPAPLAITGRIPHTGTVATPPSGQRGGTIRVTVGIPTYNRPVWLRQAIESVLAQSMHDFCLLISDNGSDDATRATVASFDDTRIQYVRSNVNVGMTENINRIIGLTQTEFLVVLPDDDLLYPDHLATTFPILSSHARVGAVHTAFDLMDDEGVVFERGRRLVHADGSAGVEGGRDLIERGMRSSGITCWTSSLFRTSAIRAAHGLRSEDEPFPDAPLMMRIGVDWDIAWVARSLVAVRMHDQASSANYGSLSHGRYELDETMPATLLDQRMRFLDDAGLPNDETRRYRSIAVRTYRRDIVGLVARNVGVERGRIATVQRIAHLARSERRILLVPGILKLLAALIIGRPISV